MSAESKSVAAAEEHPLIGTSIGKHKITRVIGMGGMGAVFEAVHDSLNQRVAIKVMHAKLSLDKESVARFMKEARTTSLVHHVGLVKVHDFGQLPDGSAYMMMEYLEGESLRARLAKVERLSVPDALRITRQIAAALAAAHEKGVVHRDLKPENVLLVPDSETPSGERAKVLDFGIAKVMEPEEGEVLKTTTGAILGTPTYMSPEQCRGVGAVTDKSDVYSLGCMLYQMLGGRTPFVGSGSGDLIAMHIMEQPQPLHELAPNVSADVETLVHQMLEKKPAVRPSMKQVLASLEQLGLSSTASGYGQVVIVAPPPSVSRPEEPRKKSALPIVMGLIAVVAVGGGAAVVLSQKNQAPVNPQPPIGAGQNPLVSPINPPMNATKPSAVKLEVQSDPPGAQVLSAVDQRPLGTTPWKLERPIVEGKLEVVVRLPGFFDQKLVFDGTHDDSRPIKLAAAPPVVPGVKKPIFFRKPLQKPVGKPSSPGTKKPDDDLDVPVVR